MPNVTNIYTGNSTHTDFGALAEGTNGIMKSYYDVESYNEPRPQEFAHFLSEDVKLTNGRIVKFLKIANNRVYFQILEPYDLDTAAGRSIGTPDFKNMFARFYPINTLSGYANDHTVTQSGKYEIIVENDSSIFVV